MRLNKEDPVSLFIQGKISENILQRRLEKLTAEELESYDRNSWCGFLMQINEMRHQGTISSETKRLIVELLSEDLLIDLAFKTRGNDYICALAINEMKDQASLQKVMEYYHRVSPFRIYMWEGEKLVYTDHPIGTSFERGGLAVWALLQRIDREHFRQAWDNCGRKSQWVD